MNNISLYWVTSAQIKKVKVMIYTMHHHRTVWITNVRYSCSESGWCHRKRLIQNSQCLMQNIEKQNQFNVNTSKWNRMAINFMSLKLFHWFQNSIWLLPHDAIFGGKYVFVEAKLLFIALARKVNIPNMQSSSDTFYNRPVLLQYSNLRANSTFAFNDFVHWSIYSLQFIPWHNVLMQRSLYENLKKDLMLRGEIDSIAQHFLLFLD